MKEKVCRSVFLLVVLAAFSFVTACESSTIAGTYDTSGDTDTDTDNDTDGDSDGDGDGDSSDDDDTSTSIDGCEGIDFLFIIDSSGSMEEEQQNVKNSFPGFVEAITDTLAFDNFHIMAIDTDSANFSSTSSMMCGTPGCCVDWCESQLPWHECTESSSEPHQPCTEWNPNFSYCDTTLGAGHMGLNTGQFCDLEGGSRYIMPDQTDLDDSFACIAEMGTSGDGYEKAMEAMVEAVGPLDTNGECNDGFIRDEALLVVTFITDEDEACTEEGEECSDGVPESWKQALVDAKGGNEESIVVLGVFGDNDQADGICEELSDDGYTGAQAAPLLRQFTESFIHNHYCSVCLTDYTECFIEAVSIIDTACEDMPPV